MYLKNGMKAFTAKALFSHVVLIAFLSHYSNAITTNEKAGSMEIRQGK